MIDTITINVHRLSKILQDVHLHERSKENEFTKALVSNSEDTINNIIYYHDSGNSLIHTVKRKFHHNPSSNYLVSHYILKEQDKIKFEFSIPKYIFGTNVYQFVDYFDDSLEKTYTILIEFIKKFINNTFICPIDFADVEIERIDLCYNQFFTTKSEAFNYAEQQHGLLNTLGTAKKKQKYDGGLFYATRRYSFKIYHKGKEFEKHDYKQLAKNNYQNHDIEYLKNQADKILRYELSCRKTQINYLHNQNSERDKASTKVFCYTIGTPQITSHEDAIFYENVRRFNFKTFKLIYEFYQKNFEHFQLTSNNDTTKFILQLKEELETKRKLSVNYKMNTAKNMARILIPVLLSQHLDLETIKTYLPSTTYKRLKKDIKELGYKTYNPPNQIIPPRKDFFDYKVFLGHEHYRLFKI